MSHKKFGPDRFSRFDVYWIQTNRQTDRQTNKQTDKPNLYIDIESTVYTIYILSLSYPLELLPPAPHISARLFTSFHITFSRCTVYTVHAHIDPPFSLYNLRPRPRIPFLSKNVPPLCTHALYPFLSVFVLIILPLQTCPPSFPFSPTCPPFSYTFNDFLYMSATSPPSPSLYSVECPFPSIV